MGGRWEDEWLRWGWRERWSDDGGEYEGGRKDGGGKNVRKGRMGEEMKKKRGEGGEGGEGVGGGWSWARGRVGGWG